ncbi:MAG: hypothetical protein ABS949_10635 [Solibacillus sp.]
MKYLGYIFVLIISVVSCFSYFCKSPILSADAALIYAEKYLLSPSEEWGTISFDGLEGIPEENIRVNLLQKSGFWNELFNRMQWKVTIESPEMNTTMVIDAHSGNFIGLFGAFS